MTGSPRLRLGVVIDGAGSHPAAWRVDDGAGTLFTLGRVGAMVRRAEQAGFDLAVIPDAFGIQGGGEGVVRGRVDAVLALAAVAPLTQSIGLVPVTDVTHTEPFHLSKNIATLDIVSLGRAGWWPQVSSTTATADLFGRKQAAPPAVLWAEAADAIDVVRRLWDSWEDGAVIRDVPTGRYIDRDKVHYVDFEGRFFSVRGPSITPRSPQGQPLVVVSADDESASATVAAHADIAVITASDPASAAASRAEIRRLAGSRGRDPDSVTVMATFDVLLGDDRPSAIALQRRLDDLADEGRPGGRDDADLQRVGEADADGGTPGGSTGRATRPPVYVGDPSGLVDLIAEWSAAGAIDGVLIRPTALAPTLDHLADAVVPRLAALGLVEAPGGPGRSGPIDAPPRTLRERFGLSRPSNRYAAPDLVAEGTR